MFWAKRKVLGESRPRCTREHAVARLGAQAKPRSEGLRSFKVIPSSLPLTPGNLGALFPHLKQGLRESHAPQRAYKFKTHWANRTQARVKFTSISSGLLLMRKSLLRMNAGSPTLPV